MESEQTAIGSERTALDAAIAAVGDALEPANTRFCKDCKWVKDPSYIYSPDRMICDAPQSPASLVTGKKYEIACELMRIVNVVPGGMPACGASGRWFVAKEGGA